MELPQEWINFLITQPEQGMGFQIANIKFKDQSEMKRVIIRNCSEIQSPSFPADKEIEEINIEF